MPLVVITGRPCTGKSTLATALGRYLRERGVEHVAVVNDESLGVTKAHGCTGEAASLRCYILGSLVRAHACNDR